VVIRTLDIGGDKELRHANGVLEDARVELEREGEAFRRGMEVCVIIEVPLRH
jgi:phosphoenolpyruvate-protein kinase (PTS system EI component)